MPNVFEQNSQIDNPAPDNVIPPRPSSTVDIELDADAAIHYLTRFTDSSHEPELRMCLENIVNTVKMMKITIVRMSEEAQTRHDKLVEVIRSISMS